ncbi:arylsulfatase [Exophiala aquamarina CBS 119918]|uniref:Arylsulfatase n=1 Tax=Exophiala aquamarina CBS 119918 TaxID=1182545 RepID=A0A072NTI4_9EURO|nr:arylsulfatase [Exophiala aquamarina CBS 119918]KEF50956.1 arylsulfatase [Exophiala aquamarina CBS 119918]
MASKRPNFLIIVADDMGFSDAGCFGSEIRTPNIDKLAQDGVRMTGFHAAAACSPTRAMILTGTDHHIAGLGNLIEWTDLSTQNFSKANNYTTAPQRGMPGYEGYLNSRVVALPEIMQDGGYHTLMAGKWHLGLTKERSPHARGFDRSLALLPACSNHYDWRPEAEFPSFLEKSVIALHMEDDHYVQNLPDGWYSSNGYGDQMLKYLKEWKGDKDLSQKPFFAYYPFSAPHWPLQAPKEYIDHYRGVYNDGPEALRQARLQKLIELGMIPKDVRPHPVVADEVPGWDEMSDFQRAASCKSMEAYAGMVECLDYNIGRVTEYLESIGELDDTYVMFFSDNGAEGAAYEAYPMVSGALMEHLGRYYNNELSNIGNKDSFVWYGPRWAQAATAPSRLYKAFTTEGGVRVPCVLRYPPLHQAHAGKILPTFATVMDIAPTVLNLAGIRHPSPEWNDRQVVPMRGKDLTPWLRGDEQEVHDANEAFGWELCGRAAIRRGNWKADFIPYPKGTSAWQLYELSTDPGETEDLAKQHPDILAELLELWETYCEETGVVPLQPELGARFHEAMEEQMKEGEWIEYEYWRPGALEERRRQEFVREIAKVSDPRVGTKAEGG